MRWRVLDLFCGAGGAAMGLHRAWPDAKILGVDIAPQKNYPFDFKQADALTYPLEGFDFIWASPPCQKYCAVAAVARSRGYVYPDLVEAVRERLEANGARWVIENVHGAPLRTAIRLCGLSFKLPLLRHRFFESSLHLLAPPHIRHSRGMALRGEVFTVAGSTGGLRNRNRKGGAYRGALVAQARRAMGIDWMTGNEMCEAIPPAYSEFIARQVRRPG